MPGPPSDGIVRVRREVKGRGGKTVTTITGLPPDEDKLRQLAAELKRKCGSGGTVKDGVIIIQGDHRDTAVPLIEKLDIPSNERADKTMAQYHPRMAENAKPSRPWSGSTGHDHHNTQTDLCAECSELLGYALARLDKCPFQEGKTSCAKCPVHCYKPDMREKIRIVMRYAGPRMPYRHPILTIYHMFDSRRKEPIRAKRNSDSG